MAYRNPDLPTVDKLIKGRVYALKCRNLTFGIWDGSIGFIGIRTKFGLRYLTNEYHWDMDSHYGTVSMAKDMDIDLPEDIVLKETLGAIDEITKRSVVFEKDKGWIFTDTNEIDPNIKPRSVSNKALFDFLDNILNTVPDPFK